MSAETPRRGTLVRGVGSFYTVRTPEGEEYTLRCKKKFRRERLSPLAGDEVLFSPGQGEEHGRHGTWRYDRPVPALSSWVRDGL